MAEPYPLHIRTILRNSKARSQPAAFAMHQPRRGYGYSQLLGTDTPVFWDVEFRFTADEAVVFQLWFRELINRGVDEFTMPLRTEFGLLEHTLKFLPDSLLPTKEDGPLFSYTATVMARAQVIPPGFAEAAALIVGVPNWREWAGLLDQTVNDALPEDA